MEKSDKPWSIPSDIPEKDQVIVVTPYYQYVLGEEAAASWRELMAFTKPAEFDPLHPTGRCTCGGEGDCEWCMSHCLYCGSSTWPHDECEVADYEAMGYPETGLVEAICGVDDLAVGLDVYLGAIVGDCWERAVRWRDIRKDILGDTDSG